MSFLLILSLVQTWLPGRPMPTPGYGFGCAVTGDRVYAIGGLKAGNPWPVPRQLVEAYDVARDTWLVNFAPPPVTRWYVGCAALDGKMYVIGGTDGRTDWRRVDRFDPAANRWDTVAPLPWPRQGVGVGTYQGQIYVVGGYTATYCYYRTVARFLPDGGLGRWEVVDSMSARRSNPGVADAAGHLYAIGGDYYGSLRTMEHYVPNDWIQDTTQMLSSRSGFGCVSHQDSVLAIGGWSRHGPLGSVEMMNARTGLWSSAARLTFDRAFFGAALVGTKVVVIGGLGDDNRIIAETERDSELLRVSGVTEQEGPTLLQAGQSASLARGRVLLDPGPDGTVNVYNHAGEMVLATRRPVEIEMPSGVYFLHIRDRRRGSERTERITVVR